jgi:5,10-methylene-tetrahydrofolate dehydrogenase/methenyl tetrahydrofolate cyclohydrolase/Trk K+ transport system NAD-binding subunit
MPERVHAALERGWLAVEADASREEVLTRVGIQRARALITAVGTDAENVFTVLTARVVRPDLFIIARVESEDAEHKLKRAGADRVISPYQIGATHIVQTALRPAVVDFVQLATSSEHLELSMEQVQVPEQSPLAGKSLVDAGIRQKVRRHHRRHQAGQRRHGIQPGSRVGDSRRRSAGRARTAVEREVAGGDSERMTARVLDGQSLAERMQQEIQPQVAEFTQRHGRPPGLAIVLAGNDPASEVYVGHKLKAGAQIGFRADLNRLPESASLDETLAVVKRLNSDDAYDGILVQSPLPKHIGAVGMTKVFDAIDPAKDVDGLTPVNVGKLVQNRATLISCTPAGIIALLEREQIPIAGRRAVVIGRSDIVGKPMSLLLLQRDATVTICHSKTTDLAACVGKLTYSSRPSERRAW